MEPSKQFKIQLCHLQLRRHNHPPNEIKLCRACVLWASYIPVLPKATPLTLWRGPLMNYMTNCASVLIKIHRLVNELFCPERERTVDICFVI
jgi:hypothetical protein